MKQINFAVCDDDEIVLDAVYQRVYSIFKRCGVEADGTKFLSPVKLYDRIKDPIRKCNFNLICLDIDMPKLDGISLGKAIRAHCPETDIVFVSNREDKVFDTLLNVRPFGFVRKSNFSSDLLDTLRAYIVAKIDSVHAFVVKTNNNSVTRSLRVVDVVYIESLRDHQFIYMQDGEKIDVRMTMDELEKELSKYDIVRTHKGYLVNLKYIRRIDAKGITLAGGMMVGLSRTKVQEVKVQYLKYLRKTGAAMINNGNEK